MNWMEVCFAERSQWADEESGWSRLFAERRATNAELYDLTASNPTQCGFTYDAERLLAPLASREAMVYEPDPRGRRSAREAVAAYYHGAVTPEDLILAASTSEGYSFLFRLLCNRGDEVLIAQPSYPLFDLLGALEDVRLVPFPLFYDHGWHLDLHGLRAGITPRTRAIAVVHPNNPTGHYIKPAERAQLEDLCLEHGLALLVDEVFLDYPASLGEAAASFTQGPHPALTFVLSGLSKIAGLPQMKLSWIAVCGPEPMRSQALQRMEVIADTFLSVSAPIQAALPQWLDDRQLIRSQIAQRTAHNLAALDAQLRPGSVVSRLSVEGGWYAVLRLPAVLGDDELAVRLLRDEGVAVHPGHFFGFPRSGWLVVSLLPPPGEFGEGMRRLCACAERLAAL